jgi:hypothetical protein
MEQTKPLEEIKKISLLKKVFFYFNVTAYKMFKSMSNGYNSRYMSDRMASLVFTMIFYYTIVKYILHDQSSFHLYRVLTVAGFFHLTINFAFYKDIEIVVNDYFSYYRKPFFYWFLIFIAVDVFGMVLKFNDMIGK